MIFELVLLFAGLFLLVKFSSITIEKAVKLSKLTGISGMTIGFIMIAVSTSLPELTIAIFSSSSGDGLLSFGNLVGANISNLALVFGVLSLSIGFTIKKHDLAKIYEAVIFTTIIALFVLLLGTIDLVVGMFLLILFYAFAKGVIKDGMNRTKDKLEGLKTVELVKSILYLAGSLAIVIISAKIVTDSSISLAGALGVAESLIGATILAVGTTLPELSVGIMALRKRNVALAVGDGIGSIVTNLTLVLGIAAVINPIALSAPQNMLIMLLLAVNALFIILASRLRFGRKEGLVLLLIYAACLGIVINFTA